MRNVMFKTLAVSMSKNPVRRTGTTNCKAFVKGVNVEDLEDRAGIVYTTGRPNNKRRRNAAVQDMAAAGRNGQDIFLHESQADRREERTKMLVHVKHERRQRRGARPHGHRDKRRRSNNSARLCLCKFRQAHAARSKTHKDSPK